jgi:hypothetical protein
MKWRQSLLGCGSWGGAVAAPLFCFVLARFIRPHLNIARVLFYGSIVGLSLFALDLLSVSMFGAVRIRQVIGPAYFPAHAFATLLSAAFLAGSLLLGRRNLASRWILVAVMSWVFGVFSIFYQYGVAESLYGIDGVGGPFSDAASS